MNCPLMWETTISGRFPRGGSVADANDGSVLMEHTTEIITRLEAPEPVDDTLEHPASGNDDTAERGIQLAKQTKLSDVAYVAGSYARQRKAGVGDYIRRHPKRIAFAIVILLVAILAVVMAGIRASNLPGVDMIRESARARVQTPAYSGGFYGYDEPLALASVEVGNRRHLSGAPDGTTHDVSFGATSYAEADVTLSYRNQAVSAVKTAAVGFAEHQDGWVDAGIPMNEQVAFTALSGVDEEKVLANIGLLFDRADTSTDTGERTLQEIYHDATFEIRVHNFDAVAQRDAMVIHCTTKDGVRSYECLLTAQFTFLPANGLWELASAVATDDAKTGSLSSLEGTWEGSFSSQNVTDGENCLAASDYPMTLVIDDFGELSGNTVLDAHITLVAHFHEPPETSTNSSDGDKNYSEENVTCTLIGEMGDKLVFEGALPERSEGTVNIRLEVDGDSRITATVMTTYDYTETTLLIFTTDKTVTYTDTYALHRIDE